MAAAAEAAAIRVEEMAMAIALLDAAALLMLLCMYGWENVAHMVRYLLI